MNAKQLLEKIRELEENPRPDKEDWFDLLYNNLETIKDALHYHPLNRYIQIDKE